MKKLLLFLALAAIVIGCRAAARAESAGGERLMPLISISGSAFISNTCKSHIKSFSFMEFPQYFPKIESSVLIRVTVTTSPWGSSGVGS